MNHPADIIKIVHGISQSVGAHLINSVKGPSSHPMYDLIPEDARNALIKRNLLQTGNYGLDCDSA